jgi:hypothetical protein
MKLIVNCETGETTQRELNKAEIDEQKIAEANWEKKQAEGKAKATARSALLSKLGITAEEAQLLLS